MRLRIGFDASLESVLDRLFDMGFSCMDLGVIYSLFYKYRIFFVYTLCITLSCLIVFLIKFVVRSYLTLTLWMQPFHRLHPNRGKNILVDLDTFRSGRVYFARIYYKIGGESAYVLRVILWVDWDGMIDLSIR